VTATADRGIVALNATTATGNSVKAPNGTATTITANNLKAPNGTATTITANNLKAPNGTATTITANNLKAPARSGRGSRCAPRRSLHSLLRCLLRPPSRSERPLSFPPVSAGSTVCAGGTERGDSFDDGGRSKHWTERCEARSASKASGRAASGEGSAERGHRAPCARLLEGPLVPRCPRVERVGAFTLFAVAVALTPAGAFTLFAVAVLLTRRGAASSFTVAISVTQVSPALALTTAIHHSQRRTHTVTTHDGENAEKTVRRRPLTAAPSSGASSGPRCRGSRLP